MHLAAIEQMDRIIWVIAVVKLLLKEQVKSHMTTITKDQYLLIISKDSKFWSHEISLIHEFLFSKTIKGEWNKDSIGRNSTQYKSSAKCFQNVSTTTSHQFADEAVRELCIMWHKSSRKEQRSRLEAVRRYLHQQVPSVNEDWFPSEELHPQRAHRASYNTLHILVSALQSSLTSLKPNQKSPLRRDI